MAGSARQCLRPVRRTAREESQQESQQLFKISHTPTAANGGLQQNMFYLGANAAINGAAYYASATNPCDAAETRPQILRDTHHKGVSEPTTFCLHGYLFGFEFGPWYVEGLLWCPAGYWQGGLLPPRQRLLHGSIIWDRASIYAPSEYLSINLRYMSSCMTV